MSLRSLRPISRCPSIKAIVEESRLKLASEYVTFLELFKHPSPSRHCLHNLGNNFLTLLVGELGILLRTTDVLSITGVVH